MTNKQQQIQELIDRVAKILTACEQEDSSNPIPPYTFSSALKDCLPTLQEYQKLMDRIGDSEGLVEHLGKVEVCTGYDRCYPPNEYYEPMSDVLDKEEIERYVKAIQQYIRGEDETS